MKNNLMYGQYAYGIHQQIINAIVELKHGACIERVIHSRMILTDEFLSEWQKASLLDKLEKRLHGLIHGIEVTV